MLGGLFQQSQGKVKIYKSAWNEYIRMNKKIFLTFILVFALASFVSSQLQLNNKENNKESNTTTTLNEQVTCIFINSNEIEKCYTLNSNFHCSSTSDQQSCSIDVYGNEGEELGWMSSCGTYNITIVDGIDETIEFDCSLRSKNYAYAYYECYDGTSGQIQTTPSCKSYDSWLSLADNFCKDKCGLTEVEIGKGIYENQTKCGVKSVGVTLECHQGLLDRLFNWFKRLFGVD